jgi:hypothetical protein
MKNDSGINEVILLFVLQNNISQSNLSLIQHCSDVVVSILPILFYLW